MGKNQYSELDKDQIEQVTLGLKAGVDVSIYAKKDYLAVQMYWIRRGLEAKVDVSKYASPMYDWFQMAEIYEGLMSGVNIAKYASPNISYDRMRQIRKGLEVGIDLSKFTKYGAEELRELLEALKKKINIVSYLQSGYDAEQLHEICAAKEKGIDLDPYITSEFRGVAIHEMLLGLENNIDITCYAQMCYNWRQMREIREGLENQLDVSQYLSHYYSHEQMREIRLGMEIGLDVSKYKSLMYSIVDMKAIRRRLLVEKTGGEDIAPIQGEDGYNEYLFDTSRDGRICFLEDKSVDYDHSKRIAVVEQDKAIAIYHPAKEGIDGLSVSGAPIKAPKGREKKVFTGKGIRYDKDTNTYYANYSGQISLDEEKNQLEIEPVEILSNVTTLNGQVVFEGNLYVKGNVDTGAVINVTGNVIIEGHVEGARITCGGDLFVRNGINSKGIGAIQAGGNVECPYIEAANIQAEGNLYTKYCMSSNISVKGEVQILGGKASIIGGEVEAGKGIICGCLGNDSGVKTKVSIVTDEALYDKEMYISRLLSQTIKELRMLNEAKDKLLLQLSGEERNTNEMYLKLEKAIYTKNLEKVELLKEQKEVRDLIKESVFARITAMECAYIGTTVGFDKVSMKLSEDIEKAELHAVNGRIIIEYYQE